MKIYTGCDVESVARFEELLRKEHFCKRIFTEAEWEHICASGHFQSPGPGPVRAAAPGAGPCVG